VKSVCVSPFSHSPLLLQALVYMGVDAVMLDNEHGVIPEDELLAALAALAGKARAIVRPEQTSIAMAEKYWTLGARSLLLPKVEDFSELADIIAHVRALAGDEWNERTVVPLLESRATLDRVEELGGIDGLATVSIGPYDLSLDMGVSDMRTDPVLIDYLEDRIITLDRAGLKVSIYMLPEWMPRLGELPISQYNIGVHEMVGAFLKDFHAR